MTRPRNPAAPTPPAPPAPPARGALFKPAHLPFLLMALAFLLCAFGLFWGLPNLYDFAQDSVVPLGSLAQVNASPEQVTSYRYPPFHFFLLRAAFLPARLLLLSPDLAQNLKVASTLFILSARLVSLAMALGVVWLLYRTGRRLWDRSAGLAAGLLFILSPVTLYYARNANLDIPYVFWLAVALFLYVRILQENRALDHLWLGIAAALAVCTKDQAYGFIALMPAAFLPMLRRDRAGAGARLALGLAGFLIPFLLIHNILFHPDSFRRHVETILGPGSQPWRECARGLAGQLRLLVETVLRLMDAWTLAGLALAATGLAVAWREKEKRRLWLALLLPAAAYYATFPAVIGYCYPRFVLPILLVLSLFAGRAVTVLWQRPRGRVLAVALLAWIGLAGVSLDYAMSEYERYDAQRWLETEVSPDTRIAYIGDMRDMPRFNEPLDPHAVEPGGLAALNPPPDLLILSFEPGHPATGAVPLRLSSLLRRHLGAWGRVPERRDPPGRGFQERLVAGELGYREIRRFESPVARLVPEVAESANRTIVILGRERK